MYYNCYIKYILKTATKHALKVHLLKQWRSIYGCDQWCFVQSMGCCFEVHSLRTLKYAPKIASSAETHPTYALYSIVITSCMHDVYRNKHGVNTHLGYGKI